MKLGRSEIGDGCPCYIVAEIGINHNGDLGQAIELIKVAHEAGCNAVKFQKRTVEMVYTREELDKPRESVFGHTNGDLKRGLEFGHHEYANIDDYCHSVGMDWFASCWDNESVEFIEQFDPPCYKVASASLTSDAQLRHMRAQGKPLILSTGMSTLEQIDHAVEVLGKDDLVIMHCVSTYPAYNSELNLNTIATLRHRYGIPVGYSGHELGVVTTAVAVALGACMVERHITLSRNLWGSDQSASMEPNELKELVRDIRQVEAAMGDGVKRLLEREIPIMQKLRRG